MVSKGVLELLTLEAGGTFLHDDKVQGTAKRRDGRSRQGGFLKTSWSRAQGHGDGGGRGTCPRPHARKWLSWCGFLCCELQMPEGGAFLASSSGENIVLLSPQPRLGVRRPGVGAWPAGDGQECMQEGFPKEVQL